MKLSFFTLFFICAGLILSGCSMTGLATGIGAGVGVAAAQEGGLSRAYSDAKIQTQINRLWFEYDVDMFRKVDMTVNQGRVLLTGVVQDPEHRVEAVRLAWQPEDVVQVINEIRVADSAGITGYARDSWITTRLRTALTLDKEIQSINYSIDTVNGIVYLMGTAQSRAERNRVIEKARTISGVRQVVSYVKLAGENLKNPAPARAQDHSAPEYESDFRSVNGSEFQNSRIREVDSEMLLQSGPPRDAAP